VLFTKKRELLTDLDMSPMPAYELIDVNKYYALNNKMTLYIGSGCPYNCSFCTTSIMWERTYRTKSPKRIISEIVYLKEKYGVTNFDFIHDNITANQKRVNEILDAIIENK